MLVKPLLALLERGINDDCLEMEDIRLRLDVGERILVLVMTPKEAIDAAMAAADEAAKQFAPTSPGQMDAGVRELLDACGNYIETVLHTIGYAAVTSRTPREHVIARFLFPQFHEAHLQEKLGLLIQTHRFAESILNGDHSSESLGHGEKLSTQQLDDASELAFRHAKGDVIGSAEIMDALTPVQKRLLEQVYFKLRIRPQ